MTDTWTTWANAVSQIISETWNTTTSALPCSLVQIVRVVIVRFIVDGVLGVTIVVLTGHDEVLVIYVAIFVVIYCNWRCTLYMMRNESLVLKVSLKLMKIQRTNLTSLKKHNSNEVLRVALCSNPVFNEMWFLTVDPFKRKSSFIAELSERQYCWRVFRGLSLSRTYPILWLTQLPLLAFALHRWRLWLSWNCTISSKYPFLHHSSPFANHMHWRTGVDNKFSLLRFQIWYRRAPTSWPKWLPIKFRG